jgi:hypothetical protein
MLVCGSAARTVEVRMRAGDFEYGVEAYCLDRVLTLVLDPTVGLGIQ